MNKIYAKRNTEKLGEHYERHVEHMTLEKLNSKSQIAAELAIRDKKVEILMTMLRSVGANMDIVNGSVNAITREYTVVGR